MQYGHDVIDVSRDSDGGYLRRGITSYKFTLNRVKRQKLGSGCPIFKRMGPDYVPSSTCQTVNINVFHLLCITCLLSYDTIT